MSIVTSGAELTPFPLIVVEPLSVGKSDEKLEALRKEYEEELAKKSSSAVEISSIADYHTSTAHRC
mgnify:CR=1 FL=1